MNKVKFWAKMFAPVLVVCLSSQFSIADNKATVEYTDRPASNQVVVLLPEDPFPTKAKKVQTIEVGDEHAGDCSYEDLMAKAQQFALQSNANIIKITEMKARNKANICDHLTATLYHAENPKPFEREIKWTKDRKLTWDDFRGPVQKQMGPLVAAATYCGFGFETNQLSADNTKLKILVYNSFYTDKSWGHKNERTPEVLVHEQGHFDLCEVYTRKLRERMTKASANVTVHNLKLTLESIYEGIKVEYSARQERYEEETEHGLIADAQDRWVNDIAKELQASEEWAN